MNYIGKLYGRHIGEYFDTGRTSAEWDQLEAEKKELIEALTNLLNAVHGLPPLTAIAGVLEDEYKSAENLINKLKQ